MFQAPRNRGSLSILDREMKRLSQEMMESSRERMPEQGDRGMFIRQTRVFNRNAAKDEIVDTLEEAARLLDREATKIRQAVTDMRNDGVHEVEAVVRSLIWMQPKLGIDQLLVLVAQYSRNFEGE